MSARIRITTKVDRLAGSRVVTPTVHFKGRSLRVDGNLPGSLTRLIPRAWGRVRSDAWVPFVERTLVLGKL